MSSRFDVRSPWLRLGLAACLSALAAALAVPIAAAGASPHGRVASTLSLSGTGRLHLTSHHGFTLNEQGSASGTISGTIYIHLHIVSTNRVTAEVSIYPRGGSLTGYASAGYHPSGGVATFNGTMSVTRGTGRYNGARGSGLRFTGTLPPPHPALPVRARG